MCEHAWSVAVSVDQRAYVRKHCFMPGYEDFLIVGASCMPQSAKKQLDTPSIDDNATPAFAGHTCTGPTRHFHPIYAAWADGRSTSVARMHAIHSYLCLLALPCLAFLAACLACLTQHTTARGLVVFILWSVGVGLCTFLALPGFILRVRCLITVDDAPSHMPCHGTMCMCM